MEGRITTLTMDHSTLISCNDTMIKAFEDAIHLNNESVLLLAFGNNVKALENLHTAINRLMNSTLVPHSNALPNLSVSSSALEEKLSVATASVIIPNLEDDRFFIYNRALQFLPEQDIINNRGNVIQFYKAIIFFNLAISYHAEGLVQTNFHKNATHKSMFDQAILYYEMVLELIDEIALVSDQAQQLMIATLNNQSQIYFSFHNIEQSENNMSLMEIMSDSICLSIGNDMTYSTITEERDIHEFFLNRTLFKLPTAAASA